jgi:hypothetical protein
VLENMYFMDVNFLNKIEANTKDSKVSFTVLKNEEDLNLFCAPILRYETDENITRTILFQVFNHSINYRSKAKDILTMSNVPSTISKHDYYTQSLYNRAIVSIGICAFRNGKLLETQQFLSEICGYAKIKEQGKDVIREFLAQGLRISGT